MGGLGGLPASERLERMRKEQVVPEADLSHGLEGEEGMAALGRDGYEGQPENQPDYTG
jgi:hypothetical protein